METFENEFSIGKKWIIENFANGGPETVPLISEFEAAFDRIKESIPFENEQDNQALAYFLYHGCCRLDRWCGVRDMIDAEQSRYFSWFLEALKVVEPAGSSNTQIFSLDKLKDDLYALCDECAFENLQKEKVEAIRKTIFEIDEPFDDLIIQRFKEKKGELIRLIDGIERNSIKTVFNTSIPYQIDQRRLSINFKKNGIKIHVRLHPNFVEEPPESVFGSDTPIIPVGASNWSFGSTDVSIEFNALIDGDVKCESLHALEGNPGPVDGWSKSRVMTFSIIHEISWSLRAQNTNQYHRIPSPSDIGEIESYLIKASAERYDYMVSGSPYIFTLFEPSTSVEVIDLGEIPKIPWSQKCRAMVTMYMALGDTNEALFWLNVAMEALIKERIETISVDAKRSDLVEALNTPKAFWAEAEEIVSTQIPALKGEIKWPEAQIHVSIYAKLKVLHNWVTMKSKIKELLKHYKIVSQDRNDLFHGASDGRLDITTIKNGIESYEWIEKNMVYDDQSELT